MRRFKNSKLYKKLAYILGPVFVFFSAVFYFLKDVLKYFKESGGILDTIKNTVDLITPELSSWVRFIVFILLIILGVVCIYRLHRNKNLHPLSSRVKILKNEGIILSILIAVLIISLIPDLFNSNKSDSTISPSETIKEVIGKSNNNKIKIVIANFEGPAPLEYGVSRKIYDKLNPISSIYQDVQVERIEQTIDKSELAKQVGEQYNAILIIWGHYFATNTNAEVYFNFDFPQQLVTDLLTMSKTEMPDSSQVIKGHRAKLDDFTIQGNLADELNYVALLTLGIIQLNKEEGKAALETFNKAIRERKSSKNASELYQAYLLRSSAHELNGNYEEAITDSKKVIAEKPNKSAGYLRLAHSYIPFGRNKDIEYNYNKAISLTENSTPNPNIYVCRCYYYLQTFINYEKAQNDCDKAITLNGGADAYLARGILQSILFDEFLKNPGNRDILSEGNIYIDKAISDISKAIELFPHPSNYSNRATAFIKKYQITKEERFLIKAVEDNNKALELNPSHLHSFLMRSDISLILGDTKGWKANYDKAIELANEFRKAELFYTRGNIFLNWGDLQNARNDYEKAAKLAPNMILEGMPINQIYGQVMYWLGDYKGALIAFEKVIAQDGNYASALLMKGQTLYYLGDKKQAIEYCNRSRSVAVKKNIKGNIEMADQCLANIRSNL